MKEDLFGFSVSDVDVVVLSVERVDVYRGLKTFGHLLHVFFERHKLPRHIATRYA